MSFLRQKQWADMLRTLAPEEFNPRSIVTRWEVDRPESRLFSRYGTVCCAAGWLPRFFPDHFDYRNVGAGVTIYLRWDGRIEDVTDMVARFFGYSRRQAADIIFQSRYGDTEITAGDVADRIESFLPQEFKHGVAQGTVSEIDGQQAAGDQVAAGQG